MRSLNNKSLLKHLVILLITACSMNSHAQSDSIKRPRFGDHYFTPVSHSNLPFTNTYFSTYTGLGQTIDLVHQLGNINGQPIIGLQGEVSFVDLGFSYQQRVRDWLSAYISIQISARIGTELQSILTQGVNTINGFEIGWQFKLWENENMALSGNLELENHEGSFINVLGFVKDIINNHPNPKLNETVPVLNVAGGVRYAWGLSDLVGLKSSLDVAYGESYVRGENGFSFAGNAGIDIDFYRRYKFPVGLVLQYTITGMPDMVTIRNRQAHIVRSKIAYTKAADFSLGIEISYLKLPLENQDKLPAAFSAALTARYFF